ncbi:hypothetical protein HN51_063138, partial [Arachis hypogaea]
RDTGGLNAGNNELKVWVQSMEGNSTFESPYRTSFAKWRSTYELCFISWRRTTIPIQKLVDANHFSCPAVTTTPNSLTEATTSTAVIPEPSTSASAAVSAATTTIATTETLA